MLYTEWLSKYGYRFISVKPVVPFIKVTQDRVVLETMRLQYQRLQILSGRKCIQTSESIHLTHLINYAKTVTISRGGRESPQLTLVRKPITAILEETLDFA